jgi:hypothetical protein
MPTSTGDLIARFARVYLQNRPSESTLTTYASRVDSGGITLTQQLNEFHISGDRANGASDELASLFFILFGRAPDYATYVAGMNLLEAGMTLSEIAQLGMGIRGGQLNMSQSNRVFVDTLASQMYDEPQYVLGLTAIKNSLVQQLDLGIISRADLLARAAAYQDTQIKFRENIDTALIVLAAAGREASTAEMELYSDISPMIAMRSVLVSSGELPFGNRPYFAIGVNADDNPQLTISGSVTGALLLNLNTKFSSIAGVTNYVLVYSPDGGVSESIIRYQTSLLSSYKTLDCSGLSTTTLTNLTITLPNGGFEYIGANKPNTIYAGTGDDVVRGGSDADTLFAAAGEDSLTGGAGIDTFVLAPASTYRASAENITEITDFGFGTDKISFNRLFGKITAAAAVTPIQVDAAPTGAQITSLNAMAANGVVLIRNSGDWVDEDGFLTAATAENIATTFEDVVLTDTTTTSKSYAVISYDIVNGADIWLVSNFTGLTAIIESEIRLIGHIHGYEGIDLLTQLQTSGSILV